MGTLPGWLRQHVAALRALLVFTVICGALYPLVITAVAQLPGLKDKANGSLVSANGKGVGSSLIGQNFTDKDGNPLKQYFQSRPSSAGDGYDPTSTSASNLGPEDTVDTLPDPALVKAGKEDENAKTSLLSTVCTRSKAIGELEGVSGARPYCTPSGVGAVLSVLGPRDAAGVVSKPTRVISLNEACPATPFLATYKGVKVECNTYGEDYSTGQVVPVRGQAPARPVVPADAVTASGSGLDPHISVEYAKLQVNRIAQTRSIPVGQVTALIDKHTTGRAAGFMGEPSVIVLELNIDLDKTAPYKG
ncbi:potassium-transporting ATPase subunit C [Actinomadura rudentiformis]|uniref:Potassium-transporting ATPase KdpC subunit n=1 Tax=Actinomadura rudentiformis TaxID=359158 RepID=A0A6H9YSR3_9ACTN|nr:potassium-transporting ATPase subunit C [Actinomadura rudentiformis]KAB2349740.1 potassium-transporting ATPase subunit C [Actinomadura rudentiformis]